MRTPTPITALVAAAVILAAPPTALLAQGAVEVQATPPQLTLEVGKSERLFLSAFDGDGNLVAQPAFTFAVAAPAVARVGADGTVTALAAGSTSIEIRAGTGKATVQLTVTAPAAAAPAPTPPKAAPVPTPEPEPPPVLPAGARLVATPAALRLLPREVAEVDVSLRSAGDVALGRVHVTWKSLAPDVATVSDSGLVQGVSSGEAQLMATGPGGLTAAVTVSVANDSVVTVPARLLLPPDAVDSVRVTVPAQGNRVLSKGLTYRSTNPAVVRVSPVGLVMGVAPGEAYVLVSAWGQQRTVPVTVHPRAARLRMLPAPSAPIRLLPGGSTTLELYALTADSLLIPEVAYRWELGDTAIAAFDAATRRLSARGVGQTTLTLHTYSFDPITWQVEVASGTLALPTPRIRLAPGGRDTLAAELRDDQGRPLGLLPALAYASDRVDVAAVDPAGVITATGLGGATVTVRTPWGAEASTRVFVTEALLAAVRHAAATDLMQMGTDGGGAAPLLADGAVNGDPAWSPDGTRVAFAATRAGNTDIYVMDADGGNVVRLTSSPEPDREPAWSPDGGTIAFTAVRGTTSHIWSMNPDGTGVRALTLGASVNHSPAFSRDGQRIAFISTRTGNAELFEMGAEGADPRAITVTPEPESDPAYFPNGDLAVVVNREGRVDLLRIAAGSGQRTMLQSQAGSISAFALSWDGTRMAYTLTVPGADKKAPAVTTFRIQPTTPGAAAAVVPTPGEVQGASFKAAP